MAGTPKETFRPYIEKERARIYQFVDGLFQVRPPTPTLTIGVDAIAQADSAMLSTHAEATVASYYSEEDRGIVIVPNAITFTVREERRQGLRINPLNFAERLLANEYANHCYASINEFQLMDRINEHIQAIATSMPTPQDALENLQIYAWMTLPLARAEGIGLLAHMRAAGEFGHRDDYARKFELDKEDRRQTARQILLYGGADSESAIPQVASAFSYWLVDNWNNDRTELPKDIIRTPLTAVDQALSYKPWDI